MDQYVNQMKLTVSLMAKRLLAKRVIDVTTVCKCR